eukprot:353707-Chlamydomonas_euryale.AAC.6
MRGLEAGRGDATGAIVRSPASVRSPITLVRVVSTRREAQTKSGLVSTGDQAFVDTTSQFLRVCEPRQIKLAPEICGYNVHHAQLTAPHAGLQTQQHMLNGVQTLESCASQPCGVPTPCMRACMQRMHRGLSRMHQWWWGGVEGVHACVCERVCARAHAVAHLCKRFKEQVIALGCPRLGIAPLLCGLRKLQPSKEHLTPVHADFLQLAADVHWHKLGRWMDPLCSTTCMGVGWTGFAAPHA